MIGVIGFLLFMVGAGGMDSQNLIIPAVMAIGGLLMIWLESKKTVRRRRVPGEILNNIARMERMQ